MLYKITRAKVAAKIFNEGDRRQTSFASITRLPRQDFSLKSLKENEVCYHDGIMSYF